MKSQSNIFNLSDRDIHIISDVVSIYSGTQLADAKKMLKRLFGIEIKPEHYMYLGYLIGEIVATETATENQNNILLCLKQN